MKKNIGIFSGSFNPIHIGHLIVAEQIVDLTEIDEIWFMVTPQNPFKINKSLLNEKTRLKLVEIAIADNTKFRASDFEFELERPNYTYKTLNLLNKRYEDQYEFNLIIGWDNYVNFDKWKNYKEIISNYNIYVYKRKVKKTNTNLIESKNIKILDSPEIEVSSTTIRDKIDKSQSIKYLVRREVEEFIKINDLYKKTI